MTKKSSAYRIKTTTDKLMLMKGRMSMGAFARLEDNSGNRFGIDLLWVAFMDYTSNTAPMIYHDHGEGVYHYLYVHEGEGEFNIDGEIYHYTPEQVYLTAPGIKHLFTINPENPLMAIELKFKVLDQELDTRMRKLPKHIDCRKNALVELVNDIYRESSRELPLCRDIAVAKTYELFCMFQRVALLPSISPLEKEFLEPVRQYIRRNLSREITLSDLAEQVSLEKIYFSKKFKTLTGMSPMEYVRNERIEKAKELIIFSTMSITQISQHLGFQSLQHFSNTFMKLAGCSPRVFKQTHELR